MRKKNRAAKIYFFPLLLLICFSCKKNDGPDKSQQSIRRLQTERGATIGAAVKLKIGAGGGNISSAGKYITVNVPAGAVETETEFSIQEVQSSPLVATGRLFRILPENIQLKKPVDITFQYSEAVIDGGSEDFLYPCYQDSEGYWHKVGKCEVNKATKILKVSTTHFSDWAPLRSVLIHTKKDELEPGEKLDLEAFIYDEDESGWVAIALPLKQDQIVSWKIVSGGGTISGGRNPTVSYQAPNVTQPAEVIVEVTVKNVVNKTDPNKPGTSGLVITKKKLLVQSAEFVTWEIGSVKYKADYFTLAANNGLTILSGMAANGNLTVSVNSTAAGTFSTGNFADGTKSFLASLHNGRTYATSYYDCSSGRNVYGSGKVIFEKLGAVNELAEGRFEGTVYNSSNCSAESKKITGTFRLKRGS